jgi:hypothetical protein
LPTKELVAAAFVATLAVAAPVSAGEGSAAGAPVDAARPGIIVGTILDAVGLGLVISGPVVMYSGHFEGFSLLLCGGGAVAVGSLVNSASYSWRQGRFEHAGFSPRRGPMGVSWSLSILTFLTTVAGDAMMFAGLIDAVALTNSGLGLMCAGAGLEVINLALVRSVFWRRTFALAPRAAHTPAIFPIATLVSTPGRRELIPVAGVGAEF